MPFNNNLWPGRTLNAVSASGAPKKIAGNVSRNVWVIAMDMINTPREGNEKILDKYAEELTTRRLTRFIWIPGVMPVKYSAYTLNLTP